MCQNDVMQSGGHPSTDTSGRGLSDMTSGKTGQDHRESAFTDIFGRVFLITGLCLASKRPATIFYAIFRSKVPSGHYKDNLHWIFAPTSNLSLRMSPDHQKQETFQRHGTFIFIA